MNNHSNNSPTFLSTKNAKLQIRILVLIVLFLGVTSHVYASRVKDIATIDGVSGVQVFGYGIVSGLNRTGDSQRSPVAMQTVVNALKRYGITPPNINNLNTQNVAAVFVTAFIPTFQRKGAKLDVQVSSLGDAQSLQGGILLMSALTDVDGKLYGFAQGAVSVGGYDFRSLGSRAGRNFTGSGRVPSGFILEKNAEGTLNTSQISVALRDPDFTTATRVATAINALPNLSNSAEAVDQATITVKLPSGTTQSQLVQFIAQIENAQVESDVAARVVINERTGTIVVGENVQLLPAVVAHGGLEIQIQRQVAVSQPAPFSVGTTQKIENATVNAAEERTPPQVIEKSTTVQQVAKMLASLKVTPRDLIAIFQALKESGSLQGELIIQ